jgi:hypothetical protein
MFGVHQDTSSWHHTPPSSDFRFLNSLSVVMDGMMACVVAIGKVDTMAYEEMVSATSLLSPCAGRFTVV